MPDQHPVTACQNDARKSLKPYPVQICFFNCYVLVELEDMMKYLLTILSKSSWLLFASLLRLYILLQRRRKLLYSSGLVQITRLQEAFHPST